MQIIKEPEGIYPIGHKFTLRKNPKLSMDYIVIDHLKTYNSKGELVKFRYVTGREFMGQVVRDYDVCHTTIQRGM